jgi:hypothetical protein
MSTTKAVAKGAVVLELQRWGLDGQIELRDPGEVLLRLVTQSAARVELYSRLLGEAYDAAEQLRAAVGDRDTEGPETALISSLADENPSLDYRDTPEVAVARNRLREVFATGGVSALIGHKYDANRDGDIYATEEAIRGLAQLEAQERDRCANMATKAIAAGLAERQVRLAEAQGRVMFTVFGKVLEGLQLTEAQRAAVPALLEREISALTGTHVVESTTRRTPTHP